MDTPESKKVSLEELSKDELVKKCKTLLSFAQKAKSSKELLQEENKALKKQLSELQQKDAKNELLERLTEEKLQLVTQIEDLKLQNKRYEDKINLFKKESSSALEKVSLLETENTSFVRQVKRLTDENEQLISDLSTLEAQIAELHKLGVEQKSQLLELEKSNGDCLKDLQVKLSFSLEEVQKLNDCLKHKEREIYELSQELQASKIIRSSVNESNRNCDNYVKEIDELRINNEKYSNELLSIQSTNEKLKEKVTLYHSKLKIFASTTKEIKEEKNVIIKHFKAYTEQVKEWKEQLANASKQLFYLVKQLEHENEVLKKEQKEKSQDDALIEKVQHYENELKSLKNQYNIETTELNTKYQKEISMVNDELAATKILLEEAIKARDEFENENKILVCLKQKLTLQEDSLNDYINKIEEYKKFEDLYSKEVTELKEKLLKSEKELTSKQEMLDEGIKSKEIASNEMVQHLTQSNKELQEKYTLLQEELKSLKEKAVIHNSTQTIKEESTEESNIADMKRENSEMLSEMNQMNQALKERGEIISKLEAHCEEIKKKLQLYETQANKNVDSITEKEELITSLKEELDKLMNNSSVDVLNISDKDVEITNLKAEIETLKDRLNNSMDTAYAESETMSTSTISRSEEANRLKELEGSWEERYGKLRTLAVKLKAKIREQTNLITQLEKEKEDSQQKQSSNFKTIQNLQVQIDQLQDDLEKSNSANKQYLAKLNSVAENISRDKQLLVSNEETISTLRKELQILKDEKQTVENWKKQVSAKVQTLRKDLEAKNLLVKERDNKISKLEGELETKTNQFKNEEESHKQTKSLLEQMSNECKKSSVLNLEMQDYERSVKELSGKIEKQKTEIANLQAQIDSQKNTVSALREQNKILEERIEEVEKNRDAASLEIGNCKKTIANLEDLLQQKEDSLTNANKLLETTRSESEELSIELSKVIAEHQKSFNLVKSERDQLRNQILGLQQNLRDTQDTLKLREDELIVTKENYETYRVRAQSVLKKSQNRDLVLDERLSEELSTVKSQNDEYSSELKDLRQKLQTEKNNAERLLRERESLEKKCTELEHEVEELKNYNEQLGIKHQKAVSEHAETLRNLKVHTETLLQCYRQQLSEQESRHIREIIELRSQMDKAPSPLETAHVPPSMPREEGEGSESIESSNPPANNVHPIPLERLLDSKSDDEETRLKKQLIEQESKVAHLTALLSDTEQDLAKHSQMNKVLKEEIRRQQRSVEREKHGENLEYLKNVVFKFITLNNGDERTRLVPVLNTILKLSPEETQKLTMIAKGDTAGIKAWASYLPMWSSPNKPQ